MKISVIIPVKNGAATLQDCLTKIKLQTISNQIEIIILDSMSTDHSRQIAESFGTKIIEISNGSFNHGLTRNAGVQSATGELIYFTVQDAYVTENDQLEKMSAHFRDNEIVSVTGIQGIPSNIDKNPAIWFKRFSVPTVEVRHFPGKTFTELSPQEQLQISRWDNVNAMYRKSALQELPFGQTDFAEDAIWAKDALTKGWKLLKDPSLLVYHYHHQTAGYVFKTDLVLNYTFWKHFNVMPRIPSFIKPFAQNIYTLAKRKELSILQKFRWTAHNLIRLATSFSSAVFFKAIFFIGGKISQ